MDKRGTPPYVSITNLQNVFNLLENRSFSQLGLNDLTSRGFSRTDAFQSLHALRFLGFLDNKGNLINNQKLSLKGEAKTEALKEVVKNSYKKLYDINPNPEKLSKDALYNEFLAVYGLSPRLINSALPLFLWLCKTAEIPVEEKNLPRMRQNNTSNKKNPFARFSFNSKREKKIQTPISNVHEYEIAGIKILIPKNQKTDLLIAEGGLVEITKHIKEFAKKTGLIIDNTLNKETIGGAA